MAALPPLPVADAIAAAAAAIAAVAAAAAAAIAAFALLPALCQHGVARCQRPGLSICCCFAAVGQR